MQEDTLAAVTLAVTDSVWCLASINRGIAQKQLRCADRAMAMVRGNDLPQARYVALASGNTCRFLKFHPTRFFPMSLSLTGLPPLTLRSSVGAKNCTLKRKRADGVPARFTPVDGAVCGGCAGGHGDRVGRTDRNMRAAIHPAEGDQRRTVGSRRTAKVTTLETGGAAATAVTVIMTTFVEVRPSRSVATAYTVGCPSWWGRWRRRRKVAPRRWPAWRHRGSVACRP